MKKITFNAKMRGHKFTGKEIKLFKKSYQNREKSKTGSPA